MTGTQLRHWVSLTTGKTKTQNTKVAAVRVLAPTPRVSSPFLPDYLPQPLGAEEPWRHCQSGTPHLAQPFPLMYYTIWKLILFSCCAPRSPTGHVTRQGQASVPNTGGSHKGTCGCLVSAWPPVRAARGHRLASG